VAEILVKAVSADHPDPVKSVRGCYKRGMPVVVMPDGHPWGNEERLPKFVVLRIPLVPVAKAQKYIAGQIENDVVMRRRLWIIRWDDLPQVAKNKLATNGELTIKATAAYTGPSDYTWAQIKSYFRNRLTGLDEAEEL